MRNRKTKRWMAAVLAGTMIFGSSLAAFAADGEITTNGGDGTAVTNDATPIYYNDVTKVLVPTALTVAFNPQGLAVKDGDATVTDQVLSRTVGIVNESSRAKVVSVDLTVGFSSTDDDAKKMTFVDSASKVAGGLEDYNAYLTVVPASAAASIKKGTDAIDKTIAVADLANLTQTDADGKDVVLKEGKTSVAFKLDAATFSAKDGSSVTFGTTTTNDVSSSYELSALGAGGYTAFKFGGALNATAKWGDLGTNQVTITPTYKVSEVDGSEEAISGTAGQIATDVDPSILTTIIQPTKDVDTMVRYSLGRGTKAASTIASMEYYMDSAGISSKATVGTSLYQVDSSSNVILVKPATGNYILEHGDAVFLVHFTGSDVVGTFTLSQKSLSKGPSILTESVQPTKDVDTEISYDLGIGDEAATGIESMEYYMVSAGESSKANVQTSLYEVDSSNCLIKVKPATGNYILANGDAVFLVHFTGSDVVGTFTLTK